MTLSKKSAILFGCPALAPLHAFGGFIEEVRDFYNLLGSERALRKAQQQGEFKNLHRANDLRRQAAAIAGVDRRGYYFLRDSRSAQP
ncbi:MAG: hypothetical protein CR217_06530 [Beijerinckiaceae bacterium]|nr:MAG: hypothetical protein CR217_06530 [Beijerinckiaceae bacterium]